MIEKMATTYYSPTEYGKGSCSENEYRNMWAKMAQLGTRHAVKLLENLWEGETVWEHSREWKENVRKDYNSTCMLICKYYYYDPSTDSWIDQSSTYDWTKCMDLGCEEDTWVGDWEYMSYQYQEEDWRIFSPGGITVAELNSMINDFFHCYCDYWTGPGDVF